MRTTAGTLRLAAWLLILGLAFVVSWAVIVPWGERTPTKEEVTGSWNLANVEDRSISMTLDHSGRATMVDWPASLGCTQSLRVRDREVEKMSWVPAVRLAGEWSLSEAQPGIDVHARTSAGVDCEIWIPLQFQSNAWTGASRMNLYVASMDEPYLSEVLVFEMTSEISLQGRNDRR
ncbi:hypothetical protein Q9R20_10420 [Microbacterium sp. PRF11]|uniref:hypothetical protein n=1 Tax=Microbacterium sp. PRF11 TaxID=2962593 RepID=UPI0028820D9B|nr:hypothetical protein [Microbacterium sp. PRF11]MDT0117404.1 hypothetical protein [Microbacterium sp. PRF11]